jgi:general stress protein 26
VTSAGSRKVAEIWRTGRLTLAYQHDPDGAYVALVGGARVETDPAAKARAWSPGLDRWFPAGQADPDAVVVLLEAERLEMWSLAHNAMAAPRGLRAVVLARERAGWRVLAG